MSKIPLYMHLVAILVVVRLFSAAEAQTGVTVPKHATESQPPRRRYRSYW
jgi:hypothetical protein